MNESGEITEPSSPPCALLANSHMESVAVVVSKLLECCSIRETEIVAALQEIPLPTDMAFRKVVYSVLETFMTSHPNERIRHAALRAIITNYSNIPFSIVELLALIRGVFTRLLEEPSSAIKIDFFALLERMLRISKPTPWLKLNFTADAVEEFASWFTTLAPSKKPKNKVKASANSLLFVVLSFVGANDVDSRVRLAAVKLISSLNNIEPHLLVQACKKDLLTNPNFSLKLSLLSCGLFAHGIEDQFMRLRFETLNSLFGLSRKFPSADEKGFHVILGVFVDAWLDECDWIRLTSLKLTIALLRNRSANVIWSLDGHLEALLGALDDFNPEIRSEALSLLSHVRTTGADAILRTLRCLESSIQKYGDEVHSEALQCAFAFASVNKTAIKSDIPLLSHLLGNQDARYFAPVLSAAAASTVHQAFLIALLEDESAAEAKRLAFNLAARFSLPCLDRFIYTRPAGFSSLSPAIPLIHEHQSRLTDVSVRKRTDLNPDDQAAFYFPGFAYCRFSRLLLTPAPDEVCSMGKPRWIHLQIGDFRTIGPMEEVKIDVRWSVSDASSVVDSVCIKNILSTCRVKVPVAEESDELVLRIVNHENGLEMWPPIKYVFK